MPPGPTPSPTEHATKLLQDGIHKKEPANRRIRGLLSGTWIFDTLTAYYVWEHPYFPYCYIQLQDILNGKGEIEKESTHDGFWTGLIRAAGEDTIPVTVFTKGDLADLAKIQPGDLEWYAEDQKLLGGHPKDPYKRIEILPSSRTIRIESQGTIIAESSNNMFLHETMLQTRYYLSPSAIRDWSLLNKSQTTTFCPYKGEAKYYSLKSVDAGGKSEEIGDVIWYYEYPTVEAAQIQGMLCFYNEKVDVFVDGVLEEK